MTDDFGGELRRLLALRDMSLRELARRSYYDHGYLSRLARGLRQPTPKVAAKLDEVLGAGGALSDLAAELKRPPAGELLAGLPGTEHAEPADAQYVHTLRETSQNLVRMDTSYGGDDVLPLAVRAFRSASGLLAAGAYLPAIERDLRAAAGEAGEVAAWAAYDAERQELSRQLAHEAMFASRLAGDRDMELFLLSHLAMQDIYLRRPAEALRIADHVMASGRLAPRIGALFDLRRGRALAQLGDLRESMAATGRARSVIAEGAGLSDPAWTWWVDNTEISVHEGIAHGEAGDWRSAVPLLEEGASQRPRNGRDSYRDHVHLLEALAHVGAWGDAERVIARLRSMSGVISSARTVTLFRGVARQITRVGPAPASEAARNLASSLR